jgi:hypothetical protein
LEVNLDGLFLKIKVKYTLPIWPSISLSKDLSKINENVTKTYVKFPNTFLYNYKKFGT